MVGVIITNAGTGYSTVPTVTVVPSGSNATANLVLTSFDISGTNWGTPAITTTGLPVTYYSLNSVSGGSYKKDLRGGTNGTNTTTQYRIMGWDLFKENIHDDVTYFILGNGGGQSSVVSVAQHIIDEILETVRKDCLLFVSPPLESVLNKSQTDASASIVNFIENTSTGINRDCSRVICDSGWKIQFDKYRAVYRYVPMNGDIAGLVAKTAKEKGPWFSPAGVGNEGYIKNITSLVFNPDQASRDILYNSGVNPVISEPGRGYVLYGDKTLHNKNSPFGKINIRTLFIYMEKHIAEYCKDMLFRFNNELTRATLVNRIEAFLNPIQSSGGIIDKTIVCDESNNTAEIIDNGELVVTINVWASPSINYITLLFNATRGGVEIDESISLYAE